MAATVRVARVYDEPRADDGVRILVDRLWPRGVRKDDAALDGWIRDVAPSTELRKWFGHDPAKREEFADRYRAELDDDGHREALAELRSLIGRHRATLLTATKDLELSHAPLLAQRLRNRRAH